MTKAQRDAYLKGVTEVSGEKKPQENPQQHTQANLNVRMSKPHQNKNPTPTEDNCEDSECNIWMTVEPKSKKQNAKAMRTVHCN